MNDINKRNYHGGYMKDFKKSGFTLAEVLITLGVIGVVAAMTIPTVINKHKAKVLENQFKQTQSIISQVLEQIKYDTGLNSIYDYYSVNNNMTSELKNEFYKHIKSPQKLTKYPKYLTYDGSQEYTSSNTTQYTITGMIRHDITLNNGATLNVYWAGGLDGRGINIPCDINGAKGPNRVGYDMFIFYINSSNDKLSGKTMTKLYSEDEISEKRFEGMLGLPCSKKSKQTSNGIGCTGFAIQNVCPDDSTKTYWECLYN